ncbi:MAG: hypothetical protein JXR97_00590 [Planctomycetes bacterium]|nr:hypothetical protein [Planctomycetota bacterium]
MNYDIKCRDTIIPIELDKGDSLQFALKSGQKVIIKVVDTWAKIISTELKDITVPESGARLVYRFGCKFNIDGKDVEVEREVPTARSFYEPLDFCGVHIWLDGVKAAFKRAGGFLLEKDFSKAKIRCEPQKDVRILIQDSSLDICPEPLHPWCPLPEEGMRIEDCYRGEDCWMGSYDGICAHGGLDINHPARTPLWAPLDIDDHAYFNSVAMGDNNNRWRGTRRWENGSLWVLQAHHVPGLTIEEHVPIKKGQQFAWGAGVWSGVVDHSHFVFRIIEEYGEFIVDPWILFAKMYRDRELFPDKFI